MDTTPVKRSDGTRIRRELVRQAVEMFHRRGQGMPTVRAVADFIEQSGRDRPSTFTVKADLDALGIVNPRAWRRDQDEGPGLLGS